MNNTNSKIIYPFYYLAKGDLKKNTVIWCYIGIIAFFIGEVLIYRAGHTKGYPLPIFLFFTGVLLWPAYYSKKSDDLYRLFFDKEDNKSELIIVFGEKLEETYKTYHKIIFSPCSFSASGFYVVVGFIGVVSMCVLFNNHQPFKQGFITYKVYIGIFLMFLVSGMSINIIYMSIRFLRDIAMSEICLEKIQYRYPDKLITELRKYYFEFSLTTSFVYFGILLMVVVSPFGFDPILVYWLLFLAFAPLSLYGFTIYYLDKIIYNIKSKQIDYMANDIFNKNCKNSNAPKYQAVAEYVTLRNQVVNSQAYISSINSVFPLVIAISSLVVQVITTVYSLMYMPK